VSITSLRATDLAQQKEYEHDVAICAYTLSESYRLKGDKEKEKEFLIVSARYDNNRDGGFSTTVLHEYFASNPLLPYTCLSFPRHQLYSYGHYLYILGFQDA